MSTTSQPMPTSALPAELASAAAGGGGSPGGGHKTDAAAAAAATESAFEKLAPAVQQARIAELKRHAALMGFFVNVMIFLVTFGSIAAFFYLRNKHVIAEFGLSEGLTLGMASHFPILAPLFGVDPKYAFGVVSAVRAAYQTNTQCWFTRKQYEAVGYATQRGESLCKGLSCACFMNNHAQSRLEAIAEMAFSGVMLAISWAAVIFTAGAALPGAIAATAFFGASAPGLVKQINQKTTVFGDLTCPDECCYTPEGTCFTGCPGQLPTRPCSG